MSVIRVQVFSSTCPFLCIHTRLAFHQFPGIPKQKGHYCVIFSNTAITRAASYSQEHCGPRPIRSFLFMGRDVCGEQGKLCEYSSDYTWPAPSAHRQHHTELVALVRK